MHDKHPMVEEPCARKLASTVLKQRVGQRCPTRLHHDANLALLSGRKNYKAQHFSFDKKKAIYLDKMNHKKVSFDLTKEICDQDAWTADAIEKRHKDLLHLAQNTWFIE